MAVSVLHILFIISNYSLLISGKFLNCSLSFNKICKSKTLIELCDRKSECDNIINNVASPVNFSLYYEGLCPDCIEFMQVLSPVYNELSNIINLDLVPYGNAWEQKIGDKWVFHCQHGPKECDVNLFQACAIHFWGNPTAFKVIYCMEISENPLKAAEKCCAKFRLDYSLINNCKNGTLGNKLMHEMALKTDALDPPQTVVPWVTVNGDGDEDIQKRAQKDIKKLICDTYQGSKPPACLKYNIPIVKNLSFKDKNYKTSNDILKLL